MSRASRSSDRRACTSAARGRADRPTDRRARRVRTMVVSNRAQAPVHRPLSRPRPMQSRPAQVPASAGGPAACRLPGGGPQSVDDVGVEPRGSTFFIHYPHNPHPAHCREKITEKSRSRKVARHLRVQKKVKLLDGGLGGEGLNEKIHGSQQ